MIGQIVGHYRVLERLGGGGMGVVYKAEDMRLGRTVALKFLSEKLARDPRAVERFYREARAASALNHSNICTIYEIDEHNGEPYLAMELLEGMTLKERIAARPLSPEQISRLGAQIADALEYAHAHGIVHRDIKPGNIFVTLEEQAKILDFGLAKLVWPFSDSGVTESLTEAHTILGTLAYMAPEQVRGEKLDGRADIYALGAVLYEMATGLPAFPETQTGRLLYAVLHSTPSLPSHLHQGVPGNLEWIILKCLEKRPADRYQSARELAVDLRRLGAPSSETKERSSAIRQRRAKLGRVRSLAVLPLANRSGPEQEYFVDGMTEAVITDLAQIGTLRVISRTSVMRYKDTSRSLPEIARELGVDVVIEGSILRANDKVRITVQLIYAATDAHLWAKSYERDARDILALQREVAQTIAEEIKVKLTSRERARMARPKKVEPEAYEAYLKGRFYWNKRTPEGLEKSLEYFQKAVEKDPLYALAYSGMADAYALLHSYELLSAQEAYPKAKAAALKALELDDHLAEAHTSLAGVLSDYEWDWLGAEKEYRRALKLNPNYSIAHHWYGVLLMMMGRLDQAILEIMRARDLDPLSLRINTDVGWAFYWARDYDRAIQAYHKALDMDPSFAPAHAWLGWAYGQKQLFEEAVAEIQSAIALEGGPLFEAFLGHALAVAGRTDEALEILRRLEERTERCVSPACLALVHTGLGQGEKALDCLESAYCQRDIWLPLLIQVDPRLDPLRGKGRFHALLDRMNFPPETRAVPAP